MLVGEAGLLLEAIDQANEVAVVSFGLDERVEMIRHQAVRKIREVAMRRRTPKLREYQIRAPVLAEHWHSVASTKREEILVRPDLVKAFQTFRPGHGPHVSQMTCRACCARLGFAGPAARG